jgi:uncharacterized protein
MQKLNQSAQPWSHATKFRLRAEAHSDGDMTNLRLELDDFMSKIALGDAAHDISHLRRVSSTALAIGAAEGANLRVVLAAAYFHDLINLPKDHPERSSASSLSAARALDILRERFPDIPEHERDAIAHAITAHSFSAGIQPKTTEAKVIQDADRLEALGAIGIARVFYIAGKLGQSLFDGNDPIAEHRTLNDKAFAVDHFRTKLLRLHETMQTTTGKQMALENSEYMIRFLSKLASECKGEMIGLCSQTSNFLNLGVYK